MIFWALYLFFWILYIVINLNNSIYRKIIFINLMFNYDSYEDSSSDPN